MQAVLRRSLRWLGLGLLAPVVLVIAAFGLLQTSIGLDWSARTVAGLASSPGFVVSVHDLDGFVPFDMRVKRIEISDDHGVWLALDNVHAALSASGLLGGQVHITDLAATQIEMTRLPDATAAAPSKPVPLSERLRVPHLPVQIVLDRLAVERLALAAPVIGEPVEATLSGHAALRGDTTEIALDLHRTDKTPGNIALNLGQSGADPALALQLNASEPSGVLLDRLLQRTDHPALLASLKGEGRLADWHGRLEASAGKLAHVEANLTLAATRDTTLALTGDAAVARLLQPDLAALIGDAIPVKARATLKENGAVSLDALSVDLPAGRLTADLALGGPDHAIDGHIKATLPQLKAVSGLFGQPAEGSAEITATISGREDAPRLQIDATGDAIGIAATGARHVEARVTVGRGGNPGGPDSPIDITATGKLAGIVLPEGAPAELGRDLEWSMAANLTSDASVVQLTDFSAHGIGIDLAGAGKAGHFGKELEGRLHLAIADLHPLTGMFGHAVDGALNLDATAQQPTPDHIVATLDGTIGKLHAGILAVDALAGDTVTIAGSGQRDPGGTLRLDHLAITAAGLNLTASGSLDPATRQVTARLDADIRNLRPAGAALGTPLAGQVAANVVADGALDHPHVHARINGTGVTAGPATLDRVQVDADLPDAMQQRVTIDGNFRSGGLDGTLSLEAGRNDSGEAQIHRLQLKAADSVIEAELRIALNTLLTQGTITARVPNLALWSRLASLPLGGRLDLKAALEARGGQSLDLTLDGDRLSAGGGAALGHITATARLADLLGAPTGNGRATLTGVTFPSGGLTSATLTLDAPRPGKFTFNVQTSGKVIDPLTLALDGSGEIAAGSAEIRLSRLTGALGPDRLQLSQPLTLTKKGNDLALTGLALGIGSGQITGNMAKRGAALSADIAARNLPIASAGRLAGHREAGGTLSLQLNVGGTVTAPQGRFSMTGRELRFALAKAQHLPTLGLDVSGTWNGRELSLNGKVSGIKNDRLELSGSAPLVLTPSLGISVPPQGRLALRLQGGGEIGDLADLLPLGEDRFTGTFALDGAVEGTPASPAASGHLTLANGRYENFVTGAVLTKMKLDLAGDRDRITVREFSAGDTAQGTLAARGSILLAGASPTADMTLTLKGFQVVGRDEATVTASGDVAVAGAITSPKVTAHLTADQGNLSIPDSLPPSITKLQVVRINSKAPKRLTPAAAPAKPSPPALPATLDIHLDLPGHIFVRGRGLDSEWRGRFDITGTSDVPHVAGGLEVVRGTFDFLGKTFRVTQAQNRL